MVHSNPRSSGLMQYLTKRVGQSLHRVADFVQGTPVILLKALLYLLRIGSIREYWREATPFFITSISGRVKEKALTTIIGAYFGMKA